MSVPPSTIMESAGTFPTPTSSGTERGSFTLNEGPSSIGDHVGIGDVLSAHQSSVDRAQRYVYVVVSSLGQTLKSSPVPQMRQSVEIPDERMMVCWWQGLYNVHHSFPRI